MNFVTVLCSVADEVTVKLPRCVSCGKDNATVDCYASTASSQPHKVCPGCLMHAMTVKKDVTCPQCKGHLINNGQALDTARVLGNAVMANASDLFLQDKTPNEVSLLNKVDKAEELMEQWIELLLRGSLLTLKKKNIRNTVLAQQANTLIQHKLALLRKHTKESNTIMIRLYKHKKCALKRLGVA